MHSEYGNDFITLTDEQGNEIELEHLDTMEYNGQTYMAFISAEQPEDELDDTAELIVLKVEETDGEEMLVTLDDENELETVFELFLARFEEMDEGPDLFDEDEQEL
ncbi:MAG TPA: DUF1292 domain-containing protein [Clostridiales bacterium]|nr:DUF1292 domain-containing protein [Clostridiales bacterium]